MFLRRPVFPVAVVCVLLCGSGCSFSATRRQFRMLGGTDRQEKAREFEIHFSPEGMYRLPSKWHKSRQQRTTAYSHRRCDACTPEGRRSAEDEETNRRFSLLRDMTATQLTYIRRISVNPAFSFLGPSSAVGGRGCGRGWLSRSWWDGVGERLRRCVRRFARGHRGLFRWGGRGGGRRSAGGGVVERAGRQRHHAGERDSSRTSG